MRILGCDSTTESKFGLLPCTEY
jgi:hypothetical protein